MDGKETTIDALRRMGKLLFPDHREGSFDYTACYKRKIDDPESPTGTSEALYPLVNDSRPYYTNRFRRGDVLEFRANPKSGGSTGIIKELIVTYSFFDEREGQKSTYVKQGYLKKQGGAKGGRQNWKTRYFVLDNMSLKYFKDKSSYENHKLPLGELYLDQFVSVDEVAPNEVTSASKKQNFFALQVTNRKLYLSTKDKDLADEWINSLSGMGSLTQTEIHFDTELIREQKLDEMNKRKSFLGDVSIGISGPYEVSWNMNITSAWEWLVSGEHPESVFRFEELLGVGASGKVYRAHHKQLDYDVAIKIVEGKDARIREELEKEIDVLKRCKSDDIVAYYGTFSQDEEVWILMDYCGLGSVKDVMKTLQDTITERQCAYILHYTLKGLVYLHASNILHLDIKAANILLTVAGDVKLADFGVSDRLQTNTVFVEADDYVGSPLFMAPEVIRKDGYNEKADIWSLGITIIEMIEGRPPNTDINCIEMLPDLAERDPPSLKNPRRYSALFKEFLGKCLVKEKEARPAAVTLLMDDFVADSCNKEVITELVNEAWQLKQAERKFL
eukprot:TRINITY_DN187_c1_g1_i2.p1 TRINITY_DN187_c1_g1~~TRINITY_DN187_c1_g1_i2.p1  ORF type:complete len:560 (-),score=123.14 TRINITY_DN187_c1_g1_i2:79-1758(-)